MNRRLTMPKITALGGVVLMALAGCGFVSMSARGTWVDDAGEVELEFTQEGLIRGTDGCNLVEGTWEEHGDDVTMTMSIIDSKDCAEGEVWLVDPVAAVVEDDTMTLYGPNDVELGTLTEK